MALPQPTDPLPPAQLTRTQQRFVPVLLDPATRHLPVLELAQHAGFSSEASWFDALCDEPFRAWVEQLGRRCPPPRPSVADALAGRIPSPSSKGSLLHSNGSGGSFRTLPTGRLPAVTCAARPATPRMAHDTLPCETRRSAPGYAVWASNALWLPSERSDSIMGRSHWQKTSMRSGHWIASISGGSPAITPNTKMEAITPLIFPSSCTPTSRPSSSGIFGRAWATGRDIPW